MTKLKPYTKYKDSGVDWLGEIPEDWEIQPLISVGKIKKITGQTHRELLSVYLNKGVIRFTDVDEKRTNVTSKDLSKYQSVDKGDFVLNNQQAWRGSVGVSSYKGIVSPAYLIVKLDSILDPEFANYMFRDKSLVSQFLIYSKGVGSIQRNLYWNDLKRIDLFIPPKESQRVIANYLNTKSKEIDKYIKKLKKEITLLKEHRQKIISQAVTCGLDENGKLRNKPERNEGDPIPNGWENSGVEWLGLIPEGWKVRKLKYVVNKFDTKVDDSKENQLRILMENIESTTGRYIPTDDNEPLTSKVNCFKKGDVLFGKLRPYLSKVYLAESDGVCVSEFLTLRPKDTSSEYLTHMLLNRDFIYLVNSSTYGAKMPRASWNFIGNIEVSYPDKAEQKKISSYIDKIDHRIKNQVSKIQNQIDSIKEYKQSLISKVVTGKIDVRNINNNLSEN